MLPASEDQNMRSNAGGSVAVSGKRNNALFESGLMPTHGVCVEDCEVLFGL